MFPMIFFGYNNRFDVCNFKNDDVIFGNKTRHALKIVQLHR
jgi:hypothetical protein